MKCPKCNHEQSSESECEACGIVFEKYRIMQERLKDPIHSVSDRAPVRLPVIPLPRWARVTVSIGLVWVFIAGAMHLATRSSTPKPGASPQPQAATGITRQLYEFMQPGNPIEESQLATVFIETPWGSGSGFFIDADCRIITNKHVLTISEEDIQGLRQEMLLLDYVISRKQRSIEDAEGTAPFVADPKLSMEIDDYIQKEQEDSASLAQQYAELKSRIAAIEENRDNPSYTVILYDDSTYTATEVTFSDTHDLALLRLDQKECPCLKKGQSDALKIGQSVFTIGNPLGLSHTVTSGIVSGKRSHDDHAYIQTDAPINPGNSGGPLIDETGRVVGINTMVLSDSEGIGFAIPIEAALDEFGELKN
ncbi:S1C family serine protease [Desulfoluna spongiiphila]|uniref:Trypsin-like peptidase domain-containing protein n=1 Tax=Desulfoluna spongiiphila TaxID=419481 RepID=A0A1G5CUA8_9BACT|nr:trypsin-like peptidase domain-containing protein [Desulfoluna spongiiphila]SCY05838.1 Trypsin-like peptidase domain-containing protein [Desulfoluna spongiiphila]VVS92407.1 peptidase s1 pa clan [Desulfoluna spongiiphila]